MQAGLHISLNIPANPLVRQTPYQLQRRAAASVRRQGYGWAGNRLTSPTTKSIENGKLRIEN
jgi:hypothetical protein